jgi:N-acyl homoserine lactone hydrolase
LIPAHEPSWKVEVLLRGSWRGATSVLLSNPRQRILVDTGLPHEAHQLVRALKERGLQPADVGTVINTHFHVDHVLNNCLFPRSVIYTSQQSYDWCRALYSALAQEPGWEKLVLKHYPETADYEKSRGNMEKLRRFTLRWWDVKRTGEARQFRWVENQPLPEGLEGLITSGHVPGHLSLILRQASQPTVIAGDALLSRQNEDRVLTMIPQNRAQYQADRARIFALGGYIIPGHDRGFPVAPSPRERGTPAGVEERGESFR